MPAKQRTVRSSGYQLRLLYGLLSDEYSVTELFPTTNPTMFVTLAKLTPAFEGGIQTNRSFVNLDAVDMSLSMMLLDVSVERRVGLSESSENMLTEDSWDPESRAQAQRQIEEVLLKRQDPRGVWMTTWDNVFAAFAFSTIGYDERDPALSRALEFVRTQRQAPSGRILSIKIPVRDTAWSMYALVQSGVPRTNKTVSEALQWLYAAQTAPPAEKRADLPLQQLPVPFRTHHGRRWGWKPHMSSD